MITDEQLIERIRTALEDEVTGVHPPADLLQRVQSAPEPLLRHASWRPWGVGGAMASLASVAVVAIVVVAFVSLGHRHSSPTGASTVPARTPAGMRALVAQLAVLRRPQTPADRTLPPGIAQTIAPRWRSDSSLTRLLATFPAARLGQVRVYLVVLVPPPRISPPVVTEVAVGNRGAPTGPPARLRLDNRLVSVGPALVDARGLRHPGFVVGLCKIVLCSIVPDSVTRARWVLVPPGTATDRRTVTVYPTIRNNLAYAPLTTEYRQPVSATWYGPGGRVIGSSKIVAAPGSPVRFIAIRPLAHGRLPGRQTFTITGQRYRFQDRLYFTLALSINQPGTPPGGGGGTSFNASQLPGLLAVTYMTPNTCPHRYSVVFGLLRAPGDVVLARRGDHTTVLRRASIPAVLHAPGVLVYARLPDAPNEVIVQRADGKRLLDHKLPVSGQCMRG